MVIVRYADDIVVGFEHEADGRRFLGRDARAVAGVFADVASGQDPADRVRPLGCGATRKLGLGKPETFDFLGFTHICGRSRQGRFQIRAKVGRTACAKLREIKDELRQRMQQPIPEQGRWLKQVITGYFAYHAVPTNSRSLRAFRDHVVRLWGRTLRRRSQKHALTWERMGEAGRRLAPPTAHPSSLAEHPLRRQTPEVGAGCGNSARPDLCGGRPATDVPTANAALLAALCVSDGQLTLPSSTITTHNEYHRQSSEKKTSDV